MLYKWRKKFTVNNSFSNCSLWGMCPMLGTRGVEAWRTSPKRQCPSSVISLRRLYRSDVPRQPGEARSYWNYTADWQLMAHRLVLVCGPHLEKHCNGDTTNAWLPCQQPYALLFLIGDKKRFGCVQSVCYDLALPVEWTIHWDGWIRS